MASYLEPDAAADRASPRTSGRSHRQFGLWALGLGTGAAMGVGTACGYLAAVPPSYRGSAALVAEARPGGPTPERIAALLTRTILSDGVLARAAGAGTPDLGALRARLAVARSDGLLFEVAALAPDREEAARLTNAVTEAVLAERAERAEPAGPAAAAVSVPEARAALDEAERRLRAFTAAKAAPAGEQLLEDAERQLALARTRLAEAKARSDALAGGREPDPSAEASASPALDRLRQQTAEAIRVETGLKSTLGPLHPSVKEAEEQSRTAKRLLLDEVKRAARLASGEQGAAAARVQALEEQIAARRTSANAAGERLVELEAEIAARGATVREAEAAAELALDRAASTTPLRILRAATAEAAERRPEPTGILGAGLLGGLLAGLLGSAFLAPRRRRREVSAPFRVEPTPERLALRLIAFQPEARAQAVTCDPTPEGAAAALPQPSPLQGLLRDASERWTLPRLASPDGAARALTNQPGSALSEAVRALRRHLNGRVQPGRVLTLLIVSDEPGTGRSTLAANLAQAFADVARRVVLIDASPPEGDALRTDWKEVAPAPAFTTVRHGSALPYQLLPMASLGSAVSNPQAERIAWSLVRLARSAFEVAIIDAPALASSRLALSGAEIADAAIVLCPGSGPEDFATLAVLDPKRLAEAAPGLRGTLAA